MATINKKKTVNKKPVSFTGEIEEAYQKWIKHITGPKVLKNWKAWATLSGFLVFILTICIISG